MNRPTLPTVPGVPAVSARLRRLPGVHGRGRIAVGAAVATLAAACALLPLVDPAYWLLKAALLIAAQTLVGAGARRVLPARPLTVLVQALVSLLLLTLLFAREAAIVWVLPGPAVFDELGRLLSEGTQDVGRYATPAPVTDGIGLMLVGGVLVIGLLVDALAVTYRSAAPAGLPLLALYSVAAGLAQGGTRWLWFLCAAGGYLLLLLAESRDRLSRWGRVLRQRGPSGSGPSDSGSAGSSDASAARAGAGDDTAAWPRVRTGRRIGALTLGLALAVPAVLPTLGGGLLDPAAHRSHDGSEVKDDTVSAVNPLVALQDNLNQPEDRTALTYRTDTQDASDMYLRIVALDKFDGSSWKPSQRRIEKLPSPLPAPPGLSPHVRTETVNTSFRAARWYAQNWLPMPYPASRVDIDGRWRFESKGRTVVGDRGETTRGAHYRVQSLRPKPTARQLRKAPEPPRELREEYTKVPDSLPSVVHRTARRVTRHSASDYERAVKLQNWFAASGGFTYNTRVRSGTGSAAIADFLREKEGFCVHFAFSMAAMARTLGIPARVAVGFTPGTERSDGRVSVGMKDAHAWPELYFQGAGWTRFEPTPTRGSTPSYAQENNNSPDRGAGSGGTPPDQGGASDRPSPSAPTSSPDQCTSGGDHGDDDHADGGQCGQAAPSPGDGQAGGGFPAGTVTGSSAAALLALGAMLPLGARMRMRRRRLGSTPRRGAGAGPGPGAGSGAAVLAAWRELVDSGWDYGVLPDDSATPRKAVERIVRIGELGPDDAERAQRVARTVEQVLYAPRPGPETGGADVAADVRRVRDALRAAAPRRVRARALLLPPSSVRALWLLSRGWRRVRERCAGALRLRFAK